MAKKFNAFPAKAIIACKSVTSALLFNMYKMESGISNVKEIDTTGLPVLVAYVADIDEEWYNRNKKRSGIIIESYDALKARFDHE